MLFHMPYRDLMKPADEVAEDVLEAFPDIEDDNELPETPLSPDEGKHSITTSSSMMPHVVLVTAV